MSTDRGRANATPLATYRLQLNADFTFDDAARAVPYLKALGISHAYFSPYLAARPGSRHGYDIINHGDFNPELGGAEGFERLVETLSGHGMGHILDFVPNHMGVGHADNPWWLDVLEWGSDSPYASYFDIDWESAKPELRHKVLLPVLGNYYGDVLCAGELRLVFEADQGTFAVHYHEHHVPIGPRHYARILGAAVAEAKKAQAPPSLVESLERLVEASATLPTSVAPRRRPVARQRADRLKRDLAGLAAEPQARAIVEAAMKSINGVSGDKASFAALSRLLDRQAYRLSYWRVAADEINYRRFFDVNDLAALRTETPEVFAAIHALVFRLIKEGKIQGLRIDHVDGLFDPMSYCRRLRRELDAIVGRRGRNERLFLVVEKILGPEEKLARDWGIDGTTGYEFMNEVLGLFIDRAGGRPLRALYRGVSEERRDYAEILYQSKKHVMENLLASELQVLSTELDRIAEVDWRSRDMTLSTLRAALTEVVACFPVYRTYVSERGASDEDRRQIARAVDDARRESLIAPEVFDYIAAALTAEFAGSDKRASWRRRLVRFAMKVQQYTAPVMAKGAEDTAFYRYHRLTALNEVGGDPSHFGYAPTEIHRRWAERAELWPRSMLATMTHDAKRGEDMRARLCLLSEIPNEWGRAVRGWRRINRRSRPKLGGVPVPDANDEYLLYQTLLGSWPADLVGVAAPEAAALGAYGKRVKDYMVKALREAKVRSSWIRPRLPYEEAVAYFIERLLEAREGNPFLAEFVPFQARIAALGAVIGLGQTLLKLTAPGIPDIYQGSELWDLRLVDPDNRRPVDFERRRSLIAEFERRLGSDAPEAAEQALAEYVGDWRDGRIKLFLIWKMLACRRAHRALFAEGSYLPLQSRGRLSRHVHGFARSQGAKTLIVAVPRLFAGLPMAAPPAFDAEAWSGNRILLPYQAGAGPLRCLFTGRPVAVEPAGEGPSIHLAEAFRRLPFAAFITD